MKISDKGRRKFIKTTLAASAAAVGTPALLSNQLKTGGSNTPTPSTKNTAPAEWRNKVEGMHYRRLGRTNFMVSEISYGGIPLNTDTIPVVKLAIEKGINYIDTASGYGRGASEETLGKIFTEDKTLRDKVFLSTKVSAFTRVRNQMYNEVFKGLTLSKQEALQKKAEDLINERYVKKGGYHFEYFPGQSGQFKGVYLSNVMAKDYAHLVDESATYRKEIVSSIERSLKRMNTDVLDIVHCPHGAASPEELELPAMFDILDEMKKQGKIRYTAVSSHNDPAGVLEAAADSGKVDVAMITYNILNAGYLERAIKKAYDADMGFVAMKVAAAVTTHFDALKPLAEWRLQKLNTLVPGSLSLPARSYLWVLQNPHVSTAVTNVFNADIILDNIQVVGKTIDLNIG